MNILKFYVYIFYRFKKYYDLWQAVLVFNAILMFNIWSISALYSSIMHKSLKDVWMLYYTGDYFYDRLVLGVTRIGPIFLITYLLSLLFKNKIEAYYLEFRDEKPEKKKKRNRGMIIYIIFTFVFCIFSIVSSSFF